MLKIVKVLKDMIQKQIRNNKNKLTNLKKEGTIGGDFSEKMTHFECIRGEKRNTS